MTIDGFLASAISPLRHKKAGLSGSGFLLSRSAAHANVGQSAEAKIEGLYEILQGLIQQPMRMPFKRLTVGWGC